MSMPYVLTCVECKAPIQSLHIQIEYRHREPGYAGGLRAWGRLDFDSLKCFHAWAKRYPNP